MDTDDQDVLVKAGPGTPAGNSGAHSWAGWVTAWAHWRRAQLRARVGHRGAVRLRPRRAATRAATGLIRGTLLVTAHIPWSRTTVPHRCEAAV